jgi:hypothetical protein
MSQGDTFIMPLALHVITMKKRPFSQSVYYSGYACHFVVKDLTLTVVSIKFFRADATEVLSGIRRTSVRYASFRDDTGLLDY